MTLDLPPGLAQILRETRELQQAYLVGGSVRDALAGRPGHDFDIEVFGVGYEELARALRRWGRTDLVGRSFGVVKLTTGQGDVHDFSIPRRDSKVAPGHKGFEVAFDPAITPRDAASRRDFTINALMFDPRRRELLDFFGGVEDWRARRLRHTSSAFVEDPLRVLRGMQFAARFDLQIAPETAALCRQMAPGFRELAVERVREEWLKWAQQSTVPSRGLRWLEATGWLEHFPEIAALRDTPQDPEWHPEGDVFIHTAHCLDALAGLPAWQSANAETRAVLSFAVLAHDFAKPATTHEAERDGKRRIVSPGHEAAGGPLAEQFLERINIPAALRERVVPLVTNHLAHLQTLSDRAVRRLAKRLEPATIRELIVVITADQFGRPPRPREISAAVHTLEARASELALQSSAPRPVLLGRHLLALGCKPGPAMGEILAAAFEAQLDGEFATLESATGWLRVQSAVMLPEELRVALGQS